VFPTFNLIDAASHAAAMEKAWVPAFAGMSGMRL